MLIGGLLLVGILVNVQELLGLLPDEYQAGVNVTIISCCAAFLNVSTGVNTAILFNSSKYLSGTILLFVLMILALVMNLWLIPVYGMVGAAIATGALAVIYNVVKFVMILIFFKMQPYDLSSLKIIFIIGISFMIAFVLPHFENGILSMLIKSFTIATFYLGMTYLLKVVPEFHKYIPFHKGN